MTQQRGEVDVFVAAGLAVGVACAIGLAALGVLSKRDAGRCFAAGFPEYATTNAYNRYCIGNGRAVPLHSVQKDAQ